MVMKSLPYSPHQKIRKSSKIFNIVNLLTFDLQLKMKSKIRMSFLSEEITHENIKFITSIFLKPTFSGVYTHFESLL